MDMSSLHREQAKQMHFPMFAAAGVSAAVPQGVKNPLWWGLASRLRQLGIDHDISQPQITNFSGVGNVSRIELGQAAPRIDTVEKIASALGISPVWLAFGDHGHLRFRQRYPRPALPFDPPMPELAARDFKALHLGLADRLKMARQVRGLSLREVGKRAKHPHAPPEDRGLSAQAILDMEAGRRRPYVENVEAVAVALDVSPGWLAFGEGEGPGEVE